MHIDGNYHDASDLNRRINAIVYLNHGWQDGLVGEFGLYNLTGDHMIKTVAIIYSRLVIFYKNDFSYLGLPDPLNLQKMKLENL